jgi:NAD(P)H-dependent FMN reductase
VRVLAISGSLRSGSSNTILLRAAAELGPRGVSVAFYEGLGELPHFNPDLDDEANPPPRVREFRDALRAADGVMICSPEYAHGVPGSLKNAMDWVVGSGELSGKPVALINASPRATYAQESLREIIATMDARIISEASVTVPVQGRKLDVGGIVADPALSSALSSALEAMASAIASGPEGGR